MGALPRTACPWCRRSVPVRRNGALREHHTGHHKDYPKCEGSGRVPDASTNNSGAADDGPAATTP